MGQKVLSGAIVSESLGKFCFDTTIFLFCFCRFDYSTDKAKCLTNCAIICKNITTTVSASIWDLKNCAGVKQSLQIYLVYGTYLFSKSSELKI